MEFEIHIQCDECAGYGTVDHMSHGITANGPWIDIQERCCYVCNGTGRRNIGRESYDSLGALQDDYPDCQAREISS
jgi:DnaJ-class molecular chaperone